MAVTDHRAGADTAGYDLFWVEETNWGQVPAGPPKLNTARVTSENLKLTKSTTRSSEIGSDRQVADVILTGLAAGGPLAWELSLDAPGGGDLIDLMEGALFGAWSTDLGIGPASIDASSTDDSYNDPLAAGTMFANVLVGQWVKVVGFGTNPTNNGIFQVTAKPNNDKIIVDTTLITETGSGDEAITGQNLRNGTTANSYVFERRHDDVSPDLFFSFLGNMINNMSMSFQTDGIVTGSFEMMAKTRQAAAGATVGDGSPNAKSTSSPTNTVTEVGNIREAGSAPSALIRTLEMTVANNLRYQRGISGGSEASGIGLGDCVVTGRLEAFLVDGSLVDKVKNHTPTQLDWRITDQAGRVLVITIPEALLSSEDLPASGPNADVIQTMDFETKKDPTWGFTIQMDIFAP